MEFMIPLIMHMVCVTLYSTKLSLLIFNFNFLFSRDKTTINFQYIYYIAFWLLENSTTLQAPNK